MIQLKTKHLLGIFFLVFEGTCRSMTWGCRGALHFRRYDRELVLKPAISLKKRWGGGAAVERVAGFQAPAYNNMHIG